MLTRITIFFIILMACLVQRSHALQDNSDSTPKKAEVERLIIASEEKIENLGRTEDDKQQYEVIIPTGSNLFNYDLYHQNFSIKLTDFLGNSPQKITKVKRVSFTTAEYGNFTSFRFNTTLGKSFDKIELVDEKTGVSLLTENLSDFKFTIDNKNNTIILANNLATPIEIISVKNGKKTNPELSFIESATKKYIPVNGTYEIGLRPGNYTSDQLVKIMYHVADVAGHSKYMTIKISKVATKENGDIGSYNRVLLITTVVVSSALLVTTSVSAIAAFVTPVCVYSIKHTCKKTKNKEINQNKNKDSKPQTGRDNSTFPTNKSFPPDDDNKPDDHHDDYKWPCMPSNSNDDDSSSSDDDNDGKVKANVNEIPPLNVVQTNVVPSIQRVGEIVMGNENTGDSILNSLTLMTNDPMPIISGDSTVRNSTVNNFDVEKDKDSERGFVDVPLTPRLVSPVDGVQKKSTSCILL